tara:strand:- start:11410 stop:11541 length:132 start_codon:yes stop_codon:yes gene_type:complete
MIQVIKKYLINFFEILNGGFVEPDHIVPVDTLDVFIILASVIS